MTKRLKETKKWQGMTVEEYAFSYAIKMLDYSVSDRCCAEIYGLAMLLNDKKSALTMAEILQLKLDIEERIQG